MSRHRLALRTVPILAALTANADAHMMVRGMDEMVNGALHPLLTPVHAMILLGLGLFLAQRIPLDMKTPLRSLAPASAIALALTATGVFSAELYPPALIGLALVIGTLVGLDRNLPRWAVAAACVLAGAGIGFDSGVESGTGMAIAKTLAGTFLCMNAVVLYIALGASNGADKQWARTAMRIAGSWIVAISLMVLAFALKK
jgi:hydrogenase/urease accessory protein HupE